MVTTNKMEELFPSEIARLVLGYLKESKCEKSWKIFLEESSNLQEYCELYKRGKLYTTNVNGKSLLDILNEYCILKKDAENNCNNEFSENTFKEKCKMILEEIVTNASEHVLLKYFPSICGNNHQKGSSALDVTKAVQSLELRTKNCIEYGNTAENSGENTYDAHTPENSAHNFDSNMELNVAGCITDQSCEQSDSRINATSHCLSTMDSSVPDSIYLQEIIKVEKDNDSFSISENSPENISDTRCAMNQDAPSNSFSECYNLNSKSNSKVLGENLSDADSTLRNNKNADKTIVSKQGTDDSMDVEIVKTVKLEPYSEANTSEIKITGTNSFQNSSIIESQGTVEISQTALCDTQSTIAQFSNLVNNITFSTNQSGYALQTTPFSNQPVAVKDLSFSSVPTYIVPNYSSSTPYMQNNAQYSFVINTPAPWEEATVGGFSLNLPSIHPNNIGPVLTSIESIRSNTTPSVSKVCINSAMTPALTAVDPVIRSTSSATGVSGNVIPSPALTTVGSATSGQPPTVSSVPSNVSSFVTTAGTVHTIPNSNLVTSDKVKSKSNGQLTNKQTSDKKSTARKKKNASLKEKETSELQGQLQSSGKNARNKSKRKILSLHPPSSLESRKKTDINSIQSYANSQLQSTDIQPKMTTRRKGK